MKRLAILLVLLSGCSSAPLADVMDYYYPAQMEPGPYYGGVAGSPYTVVAKPDNTPAPQPVTPVTATTVKPQ
jgi:hypothetical protein